jgi:hypothetical protein
LVITAILAAITGLIIYFIVHPDKAEEKAQTTSDIHEENTINHPSELNGKCQMEKPGNTTYYEKEQQKEIVDMKNTFYYQKQDNHSKGDNEN